MVDEGADQISKCKLYSLMILLIFFGVIMLNVMSWMTDFEVGKDANGKPLLYNHPYILCANMFLGEFICIFIYYGKACFASIPGPQMQVQQQAGNEQKKGKVNPLLFAIPAFFDMTASSLNLAGMAHCALSVFSMMRGTNVVFLAALSVIFLKRKFYAHHYSSIIVIVSAFVLIGWASIAYSKDGGNKGQATETLGIILVVLAQIVQSFQMIIEEKLFTKYEIDPLFAVGCEGFFGLLYLSILLPIFQRTPCHLEGVCGPNGVIEDSRLAFKQLREHQKLLMLSLAYTFAIAGYNTLCQSITKYASAAQRVIIDNCNTLLIWVINLAVGVEFFIWPQLIGYFMLLSGALVYNEIVVVPVEVMSRNTADQLLKKEQAAQQALTASRTGKNAAHNKGKKQFSDNGLLLEDDARGRNLLGTVETAGTGCNMGDDFDTSDLMLREDEPLIHKKLN